MPNPTPQELGFWKSLAEAASDAEAHSISDDAAALQDFRETFTPTTVLRLLDALDAAQSKIERLQTCWHCKVSLMPDDFAPRCEGCPDECDADDCEQEGCLEQRAKRPDLVPRGDLP